MKFRILLKKRFALKPCFILSLETVKELNRKFFCQDFQKRIKHNRNTGLWYIRCSFQLIDRLKKKLKIENPKIFENSDVYVISPIYGFFLNNGLKYQEIILIVYKIDTKPQYTENLKIFVD